MADGNVVVATRNKGGRPRKARGPANSADAADARWTVRGVPVNVRAMAIRAAADRGATVGDWLAEAITGHARADGKPVSADGKANVPAVNVPPDLPELLADMKARQDETQARLDDMQDQLAKLAAKPPKPLFGGLLGVRR